MGEKARERECLREEKKKEEDEGEEEESFVLIVCLLSESLELNLVVQGTDSHLNVSKLINMRQFNGKCNQF